jgi:hypothetical protein
VKKFSFSMTAAKCKFSADNWSRETFTSSPGPANFHLHFLI